MSPREPFRVGLFESLAYDRERRERSAAASGEYPAVAVSRVQ